MSPRAEPHEHQEIIIVKRGHDEHDEHHGGVWKIAFADFMTAMMAFFLVMWLTNATDDATKTQIAQYFNPIKLNDSTPSARGLDEGNKGQDEPIPDYGPGNQESEGEASGKPIGGPEKGGEEKALFADPYAVLAEIAAEGGPGTGERFEDENTPDGSGMPGLNGGDAYRDPFDPTSWQLEPNAVKATKKAAEALPEFKTTVVVKEPKSDEADGGAASKDEKDTEIAEAKEATKPTKTQELKQEIERQLAALAPGAQTKVEVSEGEGGVTISLADDVKGGMFEIGSAKPKAETIQMMEQIARILSTRKGSISIRGHTDGRQYKDGGTYDNWRLSTDRAQMAYYMLVRGGLDENRVKSIEGMADRNLKTPNDPDAAANRRIEIFLTEAAA
ncbi:flagellar motor protein MotB [Consotaella aegiceratis]|uniref:flagellar motor protein MotB n=1 Tax=Consotaella aegiceratis TaxID=3097961 RepID=UPI002F40056D